ncbi:NADPH-dependent 7-cyano-7-deazaguanine reductase QueF [Gilvimarinus agarilyticus]|uniref:NADPH-dependent 7-cyano-7-deazaguanine reductase QueF n=1 Tax=Gilvimarinus sp. 2_MG-2023 TaxID=3062666 RepID=UPI001C0A53E1|nr:NADPH-dependent 7-cyano-7-deazaguanine reductase QueF [Gilvimarinus sp. 2_MG-2023]MBU2886820.1 NADPH-dependent 7-cyano-7-deazaguanine reductase QueF [Gilvimarinus agarilyticus]MDO6571484.1 NADPH-dependent 7-cyano-7-deazaguanine reductase QueF [Gilvimarinus sp. 2_MG-2023]
MTEVTDSPLGKSSEYTSEYDPALLYSIARVQSRQVLGLSQAPLPFTGEDVWTGFELSWLNLKGLPQVALIEFSLPCESPNIIESKSIKLYLNSYNQTRLASVGEVAERIARDFTAAAGTSVTVHVSALSDYQAVGSFDQAPWRAECIDGQDVTISEYSPNAELLNAATDACVEESLYSDLLKSNCPVTGQPDWASVWIRYRGNKLDRAGLLKYIVSFREHQDFHEHCVERIYCDIMARCQPQSLEVYARYTRRGGLDINPYRSSESKPLPAVRLVRQ